MDTTYAYGTRAELRAGVWHDAALVNWPGLGEAFIQGGAATTREVDITLAVEQSDAARYLASIGALEGVQVAVDAVLTETAPDGTQTETVRSRILTCVGATLEPGAVRLRLADLDIDALNATWPTLTWAPDSIPTLRAEDAGRTVAHPVGLVRKLSCALTLADGADFRYAVGTGEALASIASRDAGAKTYTLAGDWTDRIAVGQVLTAVADGRPRHTVTAVGTAAGNTVVTIAEAISALAGELSLLPHVLAVYRDGRLVAASEYTVHHPVPSAGQLAGIGYAEIRFAAEQRDFSGNLFEIQADVQGVVSRNAATQIGLMLARAGVTVDAASLAAAEAHAEAERMVIDADLGRDGPRRIRAYIDDLAFIARAALRRTSAGSYAIVQDRPASPSATLDESANDLIAVDRLERPRRPASVGIRYRPSPRDPGQLQHEIRRAVSAEGQGAEAAREVPYLTDHEAADRLLSYLAQRAQYNAELSLREVGAVRELGARLAVRSPAVFVGTLDASVWDVTTAAAGAEYVLREYSDSVHTYVPGPLPPDAVLGFEPDWSATPPLAPTALQVSGIANAIGGGGEVVGRLTASALPPTVNWSEMQFAAILTATGEIIQAQGAPVGSGRYGATLTGLRAGEAYQVLAWARNSFGLAGPAVTSNTLNTAPGNTSPPTPGAISTSFIGTTIRVTWPDLPAALAGTWQEYVLTREIRFNNGGATGGIESQGVVFVGRATVFLDFAVTLDRWYSYRLFARDRWGNTTASSSVSFPILTSSGGGT